MDKKHSYYIGLKPISKLIFQEKVYFERKNGVSHGFTSVLGLVAAENFQLRSAATYYGIYKPFSGAWLVIRLTGGRKYYKNGGQGGVVRIAK